MKIRTKLLLTFLPLFIIPLSIMGYLAMNCSQCVFTRIEKLSSSEDSLRDSTNRSAAGISKMSEIKLKTNYEYISKKLGKTIDLSHGYLINLIEMVTQSPLIASYITASRNDRKIVIEQVNSLFDILIKNNHFSEISLLALDGQELIRRSRENIPGNNIPAVGKDRLSQSPRDESQSQWFKRLPT